MLGPQREILSHVPSNAELEKPRIVEEVFTYRKDYQRPESWGGHIIFEDGLVVFQGDITRHVEAASIQKQDQLDLKPITYSVRNGIITPTTSLRYKIIISRESAHIFEFDADEGAVQFNSAPLEGV